MADRVAELTAAVRPRERLLQHGAHTLTDAELVSLLLSTGQAGASALVTAQRLLHTVGGIPGLARWHPEARARLPGLGEVTAGRLVAALALPLRKDTQTASQPPPRRIWYQCYDQPWPVSITNGSSWSSAIDANG